MKSISVEEHFNKFVEEYGGHLVSRLLPPTYSGENADYYFESPPLIAELKSLEQNTFGEHYPERMQNLVERWVNRGLVNVDRSSRLNLRDVPETCQNEWMDLLQAPLQRNVVKKANRQIKATKDALKKPAAKGLLLVASEGNFSLEPYALAYLLSRIIKKRKGDGTRQFSSIHWIVYFSASMSIRIPEIGEDISYWIAGPRGDEDENRVLENFLDHLRSGWLRYESKNPGELVRDIQLPLDVLSKMKFVKPLKEGRFYTDSEGRKYKCLAVKEGRIKMILLDSWQHAHQIDAVFTFSTKYSGSYQPLIDVAECNRLEQRFQMLKAKNAE